jgi:7,8-dihydropterin-6-yl-methyl-4-(beta-D-ribofuranosyl)aminobenzene 5'-phosphate synthase
MRLTILADNNAAPDLCCEHGFSLLIEAEGSTILFDTGQHPKTLSANTKQLGISLSSIDTLVLSHGHYDHTGNVSNVLEEAPHAHLYLHPAALTGRYSIRNGMAKPIGMPDTAKQAIAGLPQTAVHYVTQPVRLTGQIGITGPVMRRTAFEDTGGPFFLDPEGITPDPIEDDLALWISTKKGLVVVAGCCHAGIINTLDLITEITGKEHIALLIGGLHLSAAARERLDRTISSLKTRSIECIVPCHCTGKEALERFRDELPFPVKPGHAGMSVGIA